MKFSLRFRLFRQPGPIFEQFLLPSHSRLMSLGPSFYRQSEACWRFFWLAAEAGRPLSRDGPNLISHNVFIHEFEKVKSPPKCQLNIVISNSEQLVGDFVGGTNQCIHSVRKVTVFSTHVAS